MRYLVLLAAWLLSAASYADELNVPAEPVDVGRMATITVDMPATPDGAGEIVEWSLDWVAPENASCELRECDCQVEWWASGTAGTYTVRLTKRFFRKYFELQPDPADPTNREKWQLVERTVPVFDGDWNPKVQIIEKTIVFGEPSPPPEPVPPPKPDPPAPDVKVTAATYFYEKDDGPVPTPVTVAMNKLNRDRRIVATLFEDDATDGDGDVPDQYKAGLTAARRVGLPALTVLAGETVVTVVANPQTEIDVLSAIP